MQGWFAAIMFSLLITVGSLMPKLLSGTSLKELQDSATSGNMTGQGWQQVRAPPAGSSARGRPVGRAVGCCACWSHLACRAAAARCCWKRAQVLGLFDQSLELWTGRVAMIGVVGLVAAEVLKGDSFF